MLVIRVTGSSHEETPTKLRKHLVSDLTIWNVRVKFVTMCLKDV